MVAAEIKQKSVMETENEKYSKTLETTEDQINTINKMHDTEVANVFEDNKTLSFIQKMRGFKKAWQHNKNVRATHGRQGLGRDQPLAPPTGQPHKGGRRYHIGNKW